MAKRRKIMQKKYNLKYVIQIAKKLRQNMTDSEKVLWSKIRKKQLNGLRFRRQHPIGRYIADFYCNELKLIVELDGNVHEKRKEYDENRNRFLEAGGYTVLRICNDEIENSIDDVLEKIKKYSNDILSW